MSRRSCSLDTLWGMKYLCPSWPSLIKLLWVLFDLLSSRKSHVELNLWRRHTWPGARKHIHPRGSNCSRWIALNAFQKGIPVRVCNVALEFSTNFRNCRAYVKFVQKRKRTRAVRPLKWCWTRWKSSCVLDWVDDVFALGVRVCISVKGYAATTSKFKILNNILINFGDVSDNCCQAVANSWIVSNLWLEWNYFRKVKKGPVCSSNMAETLAYEWIKGNNSY